jgi:hypothetical protein
MCIIKMIVAVILKNDKNGADVAVFMTVRLLLHESKQDGKGGTSQGLGPRYTGVNDPVAKIQPALSVRIERL